MPQYIHESTDYKTGQVTQVIVPWTAETLLAEIAELRWQHETAGITIEGQAITTFRDEMPIWQAMLLDIVIQPGVRTSYEYKPRGGNNTTLSISQVQRAYQCFAWYVAACFTVERALRDAIYSGDDFDAVHATARNPANWPQREFSWIPPS